MYTGVNAREHLLDHHTELDAKINSSNYDEVKFLAHVHLAMVACMSNRRPRLNITSPGRTIPSVDIHQQPQQPSQSTFPLPCSDEERKSLARGLVQIAPGSSHNAHHIQAMVMYVEDPEQTMSVMTRETNDFFVWALSGEPNSRPSKDYQALDALIKNGSLVTVKNREGKDFFAVADGVSCRGIQCPFHPTHKHDIMQCLVGYLGNGLPLEFKLAVGEEAKRVRSSKGGVAANQFRSEAIKEFLLGKLHVDLRSNPVLKAWKDRSASDNIKSIQAVIHDSVKLMSDPDIPGFKSPSQNGHSHFRQLMATTAAELLSGGCMFNMVVSPLSGKLCGVNDPPSVDFGDLESSENTFCSLFVEGRRDGLSCPMGIPSFPSLIDKTTLAKLE